MIIITGTGRAGTTFLVELYTLLGFKTGYTKEEVINFNNKWKPDDMTRAGLEIGLRTDLDVIKSPRFCFMLNDFISDISKDSHVYIPIRELDHAVKSRELNQKFDGGVWGTKDVKELEYKLLTSIYKICYTVSSYNIPVTFIHFPKLIHNPEYLYEKLNLNNNNISLDFFISAHKQLVRPELIHFRKGKNYAK